MICPSMPTPDSAELQNFLYISWRQKIAAPSFDAPSRAYASPAPYPPPMSKLER